MRPLAELIQEIWKEGQMHLTTKQARQMGLDLPPMKGSKGTMSRKRSDRTAHKLFFAACKAHGLPEPVEEYQFALPRRWRFDYCWAEYDIALEIQGGTFTGGRHVHPETIRKEYEKLNEAAILGWRVLYVLPEEVESGAVFSLIRRAIDEDPHAQAQSPCQAAAQASSDSGLG